MLPIIPFDKHFMDTTIRMCTLQTMQKNTRAYQSLTIKDLVSGSYRQLKTVFSQIRVRSIDMYLIPATGYKSQGFHLIHLSPKREFKYTSDVTYEAAACLPGSKVGRICESLRTTWHPTDPTEKTWFTTTSSYQLVDYFYISTCQETSNSINLTSEVQLIIDCHVTLRGVGRNGLKFGVCGGLIDGDDLAI